MNQFPEPVPGAERTPILRITDGENLHQLLGAENDPPVPFAEDGYRAEPNSPGKMIVLTVMEQSQADLNNQLSMIGQMNTRQRADEVVVAATELGANACSVEQKASDAAARSKPCRDRARSWCRPTG